MKYIKLFEKFNEASFDNVVERKEKPGPDAYETGLNDEEVEDKKDQMKKQAQMDDDDPAAYKEMPGDKEARESGKVKTSKHVKSYHEFYGDDETNENVSAFKLDESTMSDIHQLAGEVKSEDEFVKKFFKEYGAKIKKSSDSVEWVKSLYKDTVDESAVSENTMITATGVSGSEVKHLKTISPYVKVQGPGVYITVNDDNKEEVLDYLAKIKAEVSESIINEDEEKKQSTDRTPLDDDAMETGLKKKAEETGVPIGIIRAVARRGLAAWKTGHRPGATQQQWAYARVGSFLTKQPGTWDGVDADLAKEVRDGGHDKKLKKA